MEEETQKTQDSTTVRIWREPKKRLAKVARQKAAIENREVTEAELVSKAVEIFCTKEERKLGITTN